MVFNIKKSRMYLLIYLFTYLHIYLFTYLLIYLFTYLLIYLCISKAIWLGYQRFYAQHREETNAVP